MSLINVSIIRKY